MARLYNLARMSTATAGTGTLTLGSAVSGYLTFAQAGVANGETVTYAIKDGPNSEIGEGVYTSSGTTLTRTVLKSTNSDAAINLSGSAEVFITPSHKHFFDQGTAVLFQQSSAPTGWTKSVAHNDKALRVVSGTASSGGSNAFSTVMAQTVVGSTTLTTSTIPAHTHTYSVASANGVDAFTGGGYIGFFNQNTSTNTGNGGLGGGSHNHSITMNIQYVDVIIATKD